MNGFEDRAKELLIAKGKMDLLSVIVGSGVNLEEKGDEELSGILGRLEGVIAKLPDKRMSKLLEMGYGLKDGVRCSYGKVAKELDLSAERIRQLHAKAIRMLTQPSRRNELLNGVTDMATVVLIRTEEYKLVEKSMSVKELSEKIKPIVKKSYENITLEELDMSIRSFVCLKRAGIRTLQDLFTLYETEGVEGFYKIKNFGSRSLKEVLTLMSNHGKINEISEEGAESEVSSQSALITTE